MLRNKNLRLKADQIGWIVAAAFAGVMVASGFQSPTDKIGVVDLAGVVTKSNQGQADSAKFDQLKSQRQGLLDFVLANPVPTAEQAQQLHDLVEKESPTDADKAQITKIEGDVTTSSKQYQDLAAKASLTQEERTQLDEYRQREDHMGTTYQRWLQQFNDELQEWSDKKHLDGLNKARDAVNSVAKAQGFTLVFDKAVAPYGANDLSDAALQAMNAQK